jgi:hypothetical protein
MTAVVASMEVTYTHVCAWKVIDGISVLPNSKDQILASGKDWTYVLSNDIDGQCAISDKGGALAGLMLQGIFAPEVVGTLEDRLAAQIDEIRQTRRQKTANSTVLLFKGTGLVEFQLTGNAREHDDYLLTFDAYDKDAIREKYAHQHRSMQLALALESSSRVRFEQVTTGTYCTDSTGRTLYSLTFSGGRLDVTVSSPLTAEQVQSISQRFPVLSADTKLASTARLFSDMAIYGREPFRAFLSGWNAQEILINKSFKDYENLYFNALNMALQPEMAALFLAQMRKTLEGKHNLVSRFTLVSAVLLPEQSASEAEADLVAFKRIKKIRDEISHGDDFDETNLPVHELHNLLTKYLAAHAARSISWTLPETLTQ